VPNRAKLTTRGISTSTVSTDTLPKSAALTNNELDSNFLNLRDQSFSIVGDDSSGIDIRAGDTIKLTGSGGATVTASGSTITISASGSGSNTFSTIAVAGQSNVVADSTTDTLTLAAGTGITLTTNATTDTVTITSSASTGDLSIAGTTISTTGTTIGFQGSSGGTTDLVFRDIVSYDNTYHSGIGPSDYITTGGIINAITCEGDLLLGAGYTNQAGTEDSTNTIVLDARITRIYGSDTKAILNTAQDKDLVLSCFQPNDVVDDSYLYLSNQPIITLHGQPHTTTGRYGDIELKPARNQDDGSALTPDGAVILDELYVRQSTISAEISNQSISILPNGTGNIILDIHTWPNTDGSNGQVLTTNGAGVLSWTTVSGGSGSTGDLVITGTTISAGTTNADITLSSSGTGNLNVDMDTVRIGDANANATITTNGTGDLILSTNDTLANTATITIGDTTAGNIAIKPALGATVDTTFDQGRIKVGINDWDATIFSKASGAVRNRYLNAGSFSHTGTRTYDLPTATTRHLNATFGLGTTLAGVSNLGNTNTSYRALHSESHLDLAGISATNAGLDSSVANYSGQAVGFSGQAFVKNLTATTATNPETTSITAFNQIGDSTNDLGNITVTNSVNYTGYTTVQAGTGRTTTVTNAIGFVHTGTRATGAGTKTITNEYAFRVLDNSQATNKYAFYADNDAYISRIGTLERYLEKINALTSSSTITVDCDLAPVHTVTLGVNTDFFLTNLSTGQSITIIITQDGTGSRTATFSTATSGAVKFAGGSKTLSTAASSIDVVTIFNDGTNYIGTLSKAFA